MGGNGGLEYLDYPQAFTQQQQTILVVEDDPGVRRITDRMLRLLNYRVLIAENGEEALKVFNKHQSEIDLILSDVVMPKMGGLDLIKKLYKKNHDVKVIFMSGYIMPLPETGQEIALASDFLEKPVTIKKLESAIGKALSYKTQ